MTSVHIPATTAMPSLQTASVPTGDHWYVIHTKPLKEWQAASALREQVGLMVYLPEVRRQYRGQAQHAPFFARYLFVRANLDQIGLSAINNTPGVLRLVSFGDRPQPVPPEVIRALHQRVEQFNAAGGLPSHNFQPGDPVRLKGGPLKGLEAVFVGPLQPGERARILLDFLGRLNEVQVDPELLEPSGAPARTDTDTSKDTGADGADGAKGADSANSAPTRRKRRTRGKGRRIQRQDGDREEAHGSATQA